MGPFQPISNRDYQNQLFVLGMKGNFEHPHKLWDVNVNETLHYTDVIMTTMVSQITSLTVVYSTVYSDADQRKHQSSASLAFVWGIHRDRWIPRTKGQLRGKCFHLMTSSWLYDYVSMLHFTPFLLTMFSSESADRYIRRSKLFSYQAIRPARGHQVRVVYLSGQKWDRNKLNVLTKFGLLLSNLHRSQHHRSHQKRNFHYLKHICGIVPTTISIKHNDSSFGKASCSLNRCQK